MSCPAVAGSPVAICGDADFFGDHGEVFAHFEKARSDGNEDGVDGYQAARITLGKHCCNLPLVPVERSYRKNRKSDVAVSATELAGL